ncbi:HIRA-interacting protein 3 [Orussus abietinus]|uniref:HIRA-interacting protein 3 n=1 Tax=Orussus abietinus TaxID=222816 RepID=UPI0006260ABD|nr:HIRA-interacting protein 3 [Orussus abietinus]
MGCNTSKESVQPAAEEAKEDAKNGDIPKSSEDEATKAGTKEDQKKSDDAERRDGEESSAEDKDQKDKDKDEAATRIQAAFRGHHARKSIKETENSINQSGTKSDTEPTKEQLQEEFRADDKELCDAATKIQASFRGHMSRKEQQAAAAIDEAAGQLADKATAKMQEKVDNAVNELEGIDLSDPDLHKAATKIQASFRGHKVRQEVTTVPGSETKN